MAKNDDKKTEKDKEKEKNLENTSKIQDNKITSQQEEEKKEEDDKNNPPQEPPKQKGDKLSLIELIEKSKYSEPIIIGVLSDNQLFEKYDEELIAKERGSPIEPLMTEKEFNDKINIFLEKKV